MKPPTPLLPIVGRALPGLAGAYLLRALTGRRLETALHGLTSVLVLSPLLYEATARFHAISTWTAAALLFAFTIFGVVVSWRKDLLIVAAFATLAGLGTSAALPLATHDALPFTFLFLAIAAAVEVLPVSIIG